MIRKKTLGRTRTIGVLIAGLMTALAGAPATVSAADGPWTKLGANPANTDGALNGEVRAVAVVGGDVYVGGEFTNAGGVATADYIARWNGSSWSALGSNGAGNGALNGPVDVIRVIGSDIYVGGWFSNAAGIDAADRIARWNGSAWSSLGPGSPLDNGGIHAIAGSANNLYVGGYFTNGAGNPEADNVMHWNGSGWSALGSNGAGNGALTESVTSLIVNGTDVYVGGLFTDAGGVPTADYIARWNGSSWSGLGSNGAGNGAINHMVLALASSGTDIYLGGRFTNAGGVAAADAIARWNGSGWSALGSNGSGNGFFGEVVEDVIVAGSGIYAAGPNATGSPVVRWSGSAWVNLGPGGQFNELIQALAVGTQAIYAGGRFTDAAGNVRADYIARWPIEGTVRKPDGRIRKGGGTLVGNNVYNTDGTNQTRSARKARGESVNFYISIQNDGNVAERYKVKAGGSTSKYSVRYFRGTTNITSAVVAGTWETPKLAPGSAVTIRARVKVLSTATIGSSVSRLVTIRSKSDSLKKDAVKFVVKRR